MKERILGPYDIFLILGVTVSNIIYSVLTKEIDLLGSVAGIAGVTCVVLVAKGSIWNYLFGLVNVSLYAWISWKSDLYGAAALNALYYFPMQFIGWWQWRKRGAATSKEDPDQDVRVKARRLSWTMRILLTLLSAAAVVALGLLMQRWGNPQPFADSTITVLSVVAQALMSLAFMEQWYLWAVANACSVILWVMMALGGEPHAGLMIIMWAFYLLNSLNGLRVWRKL